ncbi:hypothetical protein LCGC14_0839000 [marine sediment metagenome]|uniref:Uncharacterized protein n=1 Tax=marine sediment metagenome TaxID=412755 RepID=A0A0F9RYE1_9ZZZZ
MPKKYINLNTTKLENGIGKTILHFLWGDEVEILDASNPAKTLVRGREKKDM